MKTVLMFLLAIGTAAAQTNRVSFTNTQGQLIQGEVVKVERERIVYKTEDLNLGAVYFTNLPPKVQKQFNFSLEKVIAAKKAESEKKAKQQEEQSQKWLDAYIASLPKEPAVKDPVDVLDGTYKIVEQNQYNWTWSYKIAFRNNQGESCAKYLRLKFIDKDGYELDYKPVEVRLGPFERKTITGTAVLPSSKASSVANIYRSWDD